MFKYRHAIYRVSTLLFPISFAYVRFRWLADRRLNTESGHKITFSLTVAFVASAASGKCVLVEAVVMFPIQMMAPFEVSG